MSARCHNQYSCHTLRRLLRENSVPHSPKTLPQRSGKFSETPSTAQPWLPSGEKTSKTHDWFDAKSTEMRPVGSYPEQDGPLKSSSRAIITDKWQQKERWVEHYSDLYSRENNVSPAALDVIECLPTTDELDSEPSVEELSKAIDRLASGKAFGNDGNPPELTKHSKTTLLLPLHEVLCQC